ncbi:sensor histidine kinase [uncultured Reyranella sp.]|jgi:two-component sensor histidine kinase|uniref:sensor histidine kinase n=1 Tax=uncultured Reyranella sp. TaxID=735512 RepID=UPI00259CECAB|nr:sensor histidine kinase [uncultured Reyranella sp.]
MLHLVPPTQGPTSHDGSLDPALRSGIEAARLAAVERYGILDTPPEPAFDHITALAAELFSAPIAVLGFIGTDRVFFKSHHGLDATQAGRGADPAAPVMTPWLRTQFANGFHAGVPLHCADGYEIGTLCVIDRRSRRIDEQQMRRLRALGGVVTDMLTMRLSARRALAQAEMTSHEVDHRAMNSLQFVASLLQLQSRAAVLPETAQQLRAAANRVLAVARVHRTFTTIGKTDRVPILDHLRTLCAELSSSLGSEIRLESHDEVEVSKAQVLSIGLIVNELVTNARKHAGDPISVMFRRIDPTQHELCVLDSGPGLPTGFVPTDSAVNGLGMKVVNALAAQLAGTLTATNHPTGHGARFTVTFPVA